MPRELVEHVKTDLEIDEHLPMQERGWNVRKIGLFFIMAMVLIAAVGFYGDGPVSKRKVGNSISSVEYQRFYRFQARMELTAKVNGNDNRVSVTFPGKYLEHFQVESIIPEPEKNIMKGDKLQYLFNGSGDFTITFYFVPRSIGEIDGSIEINDNRFELNHFIFP